MSIVNPNLISGGTIGIEAEMYLSGTIDATHQTEIIWVIPPRIGVISISVALPAETGYAYKVEYSNSLAARVQAGSAKWYDYFGANQSISRLFPMYGCVSGIRITRITGDGALASIRGQ